MTSPSPLRSPDNEPVSVQLRSYHPCFTEFLNPAHNGQKHMQAALLREAFKRFHARQVGVKHTEPTRILDVSCGPGDYSATWTEQVAPFLPQGMQFYCTDFRGGQCDDGEKYTDATIRKVRAKATTGGLRLAGEPIGVQADLFVGGDAIIPTGHQAHILHWSHSGYHVRDALKEQKDDPAAIKAGLNTAVDKMWDALDEKGLMFSVHQTNDMSDGIPSEMFPVAKKYLKVLDDVPARIAERIREKGGHVATVNFATPLDFPNMAITSRWEALKDPKAWDYLDTDQQRALRLLGFIAYDFTNPEGKSSLEVLAERDRAAGGHAADGLKAFVDEYRAVAINHRGHINVKCAFQMICKSPEVAAQLDQIAGELNESMPAYRHEMRKEMLKAAGIRI